MVASNSLLVHNINKYGCYFPLVELGYFDCIQARTDLNGWLRKQEVKGPPDVMFGK
jgi:hypothetical protein